MLKIWSGYLKKTEKIKLFREDPKDFPGYEK
jgi:hypothetical protein